MNFDAAYLKQNNPRLDKVVVEAAQNAGYGLLPLWHYSRANKPFSNFDMSEALHIGHHLGSMLQALTLERSIKASGGGGHLLLLCVKSEKPLRVRDGGCSVIFSLDLDGGYRNPGWGDSISEGLFIGGFSSEAREVQRIVAAARENGDCSNAAEILASKKIRAVLIGAGFDSLVYGNTVEMPCDKPRQFFKGVNVVGVPTQRSLSDSVAILKPEMAKCLDSIVLGADGLPIPLAQRFSRETDLRGMSLCPTLQGPCFASVLHEKAVVRPNQPVLP